MKAQMKSQKVIPKTSMPKTLSYKPSIICSAISAAMPSAISTAIRRSLMCSVLAASALSTPVLAAQQEQSSSQQVSVASGELGQALSEFAAKHNTVIYFDAKLVKGLQAKAINGRYTIEQALTLLLSNSKLSFVKDKNGNYQIKEAVPIGTLATAIVQSDNIKDGSSEDGYRVDEISAVGPWQGRTLQQTPYSINVVSESLIQNLQATSPDQVYKINPVMQLGFLQKAIGYSAPTIRGFQSDTVASNGITSEKWNYANDIVMEQTAQIEVLTGLSGFFYGASGIGGTINYVSKKPTDERINKLTFGNTSGSNLYLHGDFGGQFDENGTFGYRLNVVTQDGNTHVEHENIKRNSLGLVLDWQVTDDLLITVNANKRDYQVNGSPYWGMGDISRPAAKDIDANKLWTQKWGNREFNTQRLGATINWAINENISWRSAYTTNETKRELISFDNILQSNTSYNQAITKHAPQETIGSGGFSYLDINFNTGRYQTYLNHGLAL